MTDFNLECLDELQRNQEEGTLVPIRKPGTDDLLFSLRVAGPDSERNRRANTRAAEEYEARGALTPPTQQEQHDAGTTLLARLCIDWDIRDRSGAPIPFSEDAAFELLKRYPYIRNEINNVAGNRMRFIKRSPTA